MEITTQNWREELAAYVRREARPVEKFGHQPRLYALTLLIGEDLSYDDDVVCAAAWLHDMGVFVGHRPEQREALEKWDNVAYALELSPKVLTSIGFPVGKIDSVLECIRHHQPHTEPTTVESTILRDADILEQLGAIGILRTVAKVGRDTRFSTFSDAVASLQIAVERLPGLLRIGTARRMAEERIRLHRAFLESALSESAGELL